MELESQKPLKSHQGALAMNPNVKMQQSNRGQFGGVPGGNGNPPMLNTQSMANNNSQLQNLVQRIQLAVSTGFLNPQVNVVLCLPFSLSISISLSVFQ